MKKFIVITGVLLFLVVVMFFVGTNGMPTGYAVLEPADNSELSLFTDDDIMEEAVGKVEFYDISHKLSDSGRLGVEGAITDSLTEEPITDWPIAFYCDGDLVFDGDVTTNVGGNFMFLTNECTAGHEFWITVDYNGKIYKSEHFTILEPEKKIVSLGGYAGGSSSGGSSSSSSGGVTASGDKTPEEEIIKPNIVQIFLIENDFL